MAIRRMVARALGVAQRAFVSVARLSFAKVVEYQARGVVHLHAVIRLDGPDFDDDPPAGVTAATLVEAVRSATALAIVVAELPDGGHLHVVWGDQLDVQVLDNSAARSGSVAGYIAKYATKSSDDAGALDRRLQSAADIDRLAVDNHIRRLVRACWDLGGNPLYDELRLRAWAHTLGYRGHWTTKSRQYSTTFTALRAARAEHNLEKLGEDDVVMTDLRYAGRGYGW